jgi:hypothetical protein
MRGDMKEGRPANLGEMDMLMDQMDMALPEPVYGTTASEAVRRRHRCVFIERVQHSDVISTNTNPREAKLESIYKSS